MAHHTHTYTDTTHTHSSRTHTHTRAHSSNDRHEAPSTTRVVVSTRERRRLYGAKGGVADTAYATGCQLTRQGGGEVEGDKEDTHWAHVARHMQRKGSSRRKRAGKERGGRGEGSATDLWIVGRNNASTHTHIHRNIRIHLKTNRVAKPISTVGHKQC